MKPEAIDIRIATHGSSEYEQEVEVRRRILRRPLGLDFSEEELAAEHAETHIVAVADGRVVGCAVMVHKEGGVAKMRQVAVEPELQGQGLGRRMVEFIEDWARGQGFALIELNARETAVPFYLRLGYEIVGEPFDEVTIPHRRMEKATPVGQ